MTLWSYALSSVENKAKYWGTMKKLAQGQGIQVITQNQVHM